jgi:hypothetical protein
MKTKRDPLGDRVQAVGLLKVGTVVGHCFWDSIGGNRANRPKGQRPDFRFIAGPYRELFAVAEGFWEDLILAALVCYD